MECKTCHTELTGPYCHHCGERVLTKKDYSFFSLLSHILEDFNLSHNKITRTLYRFIFRPGKYLEDYSIGIRKPYLKPIQLFLLVNAVFFLSPSVNTFTTTLTTQRYGLPFSDWTRPYIEKRIEKSGLTTEQFEQTYNQRTTTFSKSLLITLPLLLSCISVATSFHRKPKYWLDHINLCLLLISFFIFVVIWLVPITLKLIDGLLDISFWNTYVSEKMLTIYAFSSICGYYFLLGRRFLKEPILVHLLKTIGLYLVFICLLQFYRFVLLIATLFTIS